ncbi:MAG TPA: MerR family transcriptional regulator [Sphingomicrobium sp.]
MPADKEPGALLTIGELSQQLGVAQHILRYWETRFPQLKPMQRAGNRRYYRPADVELVRRINRLLNQEGYTVRGVQKLLRDKSHEESAMDQQPIAAAPAPPPSPQPQFETAQHEEPAGVDVFRLIALRNRLADALER